MRWATEIGVRLAIALWFCASAVAQVSVSARVVDETGEAVTGARVELRTADGRVAAVASSNLAGNLNLNLPASGDYQIRAERQGLYLFQSKGPDVRRGPQPSPSL